MKAFVIGLLIAGAAGVACTASPPAARHPDAPAIDVTLARATRTRIPAQFEAGGIVRGRLTAALASRVLAPVVEVRVRPGDRVAAGQVLVTLDGRELQTQSDQASAAAAAARHSVQAAEADKAAAKAHLALATTTFERVNGLYARRSATKQELDDATASLDAARGASGAADAHAEAAAAALNAADAAARAASISAAYAVVAAPFAGRVVERFVDPGAMAAPGAALVTIEDTSLFRLEVDLDEARARQLVVGQRAAAALAGGSEDAWLDGRVAEVGRLDPARHSFVVKVDLPPSSQARSGAFGRARFETGSREALTAPASAVVRRGQMTFVFAVDGSSVAHLRPVTIGTTVDRDRIELLAGVSDGERIVDQPPEVLKDGSRTKSGALP